MGAAPLRTRLIVLSILAAMAFAACAPAAPASRPPDAAGVGGGTQEQPGRKKVLTMGLNAILDAFSIAGSTVTAGGRLSFIEIHSQALFTADKTSGRPIPRLLAEQPTVENGGLKLTDDGKMVATYRLRRDVRWADDAPFTAQDLLFTYKVAQDRSIPIIDSGPASLMESASAPDDFTFVVVWRQPYYLADAIGLRAFWPLPAHLLAADFAALVEEQKDSAAFLAKPYWTSEYVHVGPFRLVEFAPGVDAVFDAVDHYFLGRPKVDRIIVKQYADANTLYASVLSGAVDLGPDNALTTEQSVDLKARWEREDGGKIYFGTGTTQFISVQFDRTVPDFNVALADKRVRQGLYQAVDRDGYSDVVMAGIPDRAANALLPPDDALYPYVKDGWKNRYPFDASRATATFEAAGWRRGPDGMLINAAGEKLTVVSRTTATNQVRATLIQDMWKRVGVDAEISIVPAARIADREYFTKFPGVEITARGAQDAILTRLECAERPTPQNQYAGNNRGQWCTPDYERLVGQYRTSLQEGRRGETMRQIQDLLLDELPIMLLNYQVTNPFARKGVTAFLDDFPGGGDSGRIYGTHSRNAHEWDIQP